MKSSRTPSPNVINLTLVHIENTCRPQIKCCKLKIKQTICPSNGRKQFGKRRKCFLPAFSPLPTIFSEALVHRALKRQNCLTKGFKQWFALFAWAIFQALSRIRPNWKKTIRIIVVPFKYMHSLFVLNKWKPSSRSITIQDRDLILYHATLRPGSSVSSVLDLWTGGRWFDLRIGRFFQWGSMIGIVAGLTLSQTSPGFYVSAVNIFWKHCGKRRNCS